MAAMTSGAIVIRPFDRRCLGTNSYDVHLAPTLRVYKQEHVRVLLPGPEGKPSVESSVDTPLNVYESNSTVDVPIPEDGFVLQPGELYLASTIEHTESHEHVPMLNGRSSLGRLGLSIHVTAGTGDVGFRGHWTMELFVIKRLRIYAGLAVGQLLWLETSGAPMRPYGDKASAKYNDAGSLPQPSKLHEELIDSRCGATSWGSRYPHCEEPCTLAKGHGGAHSNQEIGDVGSQPTKKLCEED